MGRLSCFTFMTTRGEGPPVHICREESRLEKERWPKRSKPGWSKPGWSTRFSFPYPKMAGPFLQAHVVTHQPCATKHQRCPSSNDTRPVEYKTKQILLVQ